jgi:1,4-alpha-glucan branching enzyme
MKKQLLQAFFILMSSVGFAQVVTTDPLFPRADQPVTITVDVTGTSLDNFAWDNTTNPVWLWTWVAEGCTSNCDAPTNVNPATDAQNVAKATRISTDPDKYQITITPTTFFGKPASELKKIGIKLKTKNWSDNKQTDNDRLITLYEGFGLSLSSPTAFPVFKNQGEQLTITANTSGSATISVKINNVTVASQNAVTSLTYNHPITESSGTSHVIVTATNGTETKEVEFSYVVRSATVSMPRPAGIIDGINYHADPTKVTLSVLAPGKTSAYVIGDFNDWEVLSSYQMKKDGEHFWIELTGLTSGTEYAFQYLIDESIRIGDPYTEKIIDPDDSYIPEAIYSGLKPFPEKARSEKWYFNSLSVLQTNAAEYEWEVTDFQKPAKGDLVIYELLVRDFFDSENRSYQDLIDTLSYFKRLGVNAIELMPVMEFNGNDSWGYNPTFMFALDKAYGSKNDFKKFVDECHKAGIAVLLDIALNHQNLPNPYLMLDYDFVTNQPTPNNKWYNVTARHPYNVFSDMNHESAYTKAYVDTIAHYWLNEFNVDGFRFDLTKGFTQNNRCSGSTSNESCFGQRDDTRIAILKRMGQEIWEHTPDALLILEHFADNSEETELSNFGFMLWGNLNHAYAQNAMGFASNSDINWISYKARGWSNPHVVGYMESHDEERMIYRSLQAGNSSGNYSTKNLATALDRAKAAAAFFFTIPGPKMLWQFGEQGYDISINENGRVGAKPVKWEYYSDANRKKLFDTYADLIKLKTSYDLFETSDFTITGGNNLIKHIVLKNSPYTTSPASADEMNMYVVGNFDVTNKTVTAAFPHQGTWYHYFAQGAELSVTNTAMSLTLAPGEFRVYTDVKLPSPTPELMPFLRPALPTLISVEQVSGRIHLAWDDNASLETNYYVYRRKAGGAFAVIAILDANTTSYQDWQSLEPLTEYEYYVSAYNTNGTADSDVLSVTTTDTVLDAEGDVARTLDYYPNPVDNTLTLVARDSEIVSVRLLSSTGQAIAVSRLSNDHWDTSSLKPGLFIVEVATRRGTARLKLVKR